MEAVQFELTVPQVTSIGNITQSDSNPSRKMNSNIYIMDTRNYMWVNSFAVTKTEKTEPIPKHSTKNESIPTNITTKTEPKSTNATTITETKSIQNSSTTMKITIASSIVGIVGTVIIIVCGFLFYKCNKKKKKNNQHLSYSTDYKIPVKIPLLKCPLHVKNVGVLHGNFF